MYIFLRKVFASPQRLSTFCPVVQLKSSHDFSAEANTALPETALSVLAGVWLGMWGGDRIGRKEGILGTSSSSPELRAVPLAKPFRFCWILTKHPGFGTQGKSGHMQKGSRAGEQSFKRRWRDSSFLQVSQL